MKHGSLACDIICFIIPHDNFQQSDRSNGRVTSLISHSNVTKQSYHVSDHITLKFVVEMGHLV